MIGNDIVDLKHNSTLLYYKRTRYLEKVFTEDEQSFITESENCHYMFWLLWSMKEAAYKCHVQNTGVRFFNPKKLRCQYDVSKNFGEVTIDQCEYNTRTILTEDYVYSDVTPESGVVNYNIFKQTEQLYKVQSTVLKQLVLKSISVRKQLSLEHLQIRTSEIGIPQVIYKTDMLPIQISLTHCGRFSAYASHDNAKLFDYQNNIDMLTN